MTKFDGHTGPLVHHCCQEMDKPINGWRECSEHASPFDCPHALIYFDFMSHKKYDKGYGIIYHGRSSLSVIRYCPYCGIDLQESGRDIRQEVLDEIDADKGG